MFVFVSGYVVSRGSKITSWPDVLHFLRRRCTRIYSLYLPALVIFLVLHPRANMLQYSLAHLFGLQVLAAGYVGEPYHTLWFIGIIIPYYVFFATTKRLLPHLRGFLLLCAAALLLGVIINKMAHLIDNRLFTYFPAFVVGVFLCETGYLTGKRMTFRILAATALAACVLVAVYLVAGGGGTIGLGSRDLREVAKGISTVPISVGAVYLAQQAGAILSNKGHERVRYVALASYAVYLFHRPILETLKKTEPMLIHDNVGLQAVFYACCAMPVLFPIGYYLQSLADGALRHWGSPRMERG
jgi:peptidoglycan/LPS O-acetylase OafA/YrhL